MFVKTRWSSAVVCLFQITCFAVFVKRKSLEPCEGCCPVSIFERVSARVKSYKTRQAPTERGDTQAA